KKIKSLKAIIKMFGATAFKNNVTTELANIFSQKNNPQRDFLLKLDSNNKLIGFNNGVYDLKEFMFREGKFDDYITMSVKYDYNEKHTDKFNELTQFLEDI